MPQLIKNIQGQVYSVTTGDIVVFKSITGQIQLEDYINLNGYVAYLQNFTQSLYTEGLTRPLNFGLVNKYNLQIVTIEIDY